MVLSNLCTSVPKKYFTALTKITTFGPHGSEDIDLKLRNAVPGGKPYCTTPDESRGLLVNPV